MTLASKIGFTAAAITTLLGVAYLTFMVVVAASGNFVFPPALGVQMFGGIVTIVMAPIIVVLFVSIAATTRPDRRILGTIGSVFAALFVAMVSINRYVQFAVVYQSTERGDTTGLARLMPYSGDSATFALEILGWGLFLGLAAFAVAPLFNTGARDGVIRWAFIVYGVLGIVSAVGHAIGNDIMTLLGFVAWGLVLYVATALLTLRFWRPPLASQPSRR